MRQIDHLYITAELVLRQRGLATCWIRTMAAFRRGSALGDAAVLERAVQAALAAQPAWAATNPQRRARVMFEFKALVEANMDELAHMLSSEHGKVIADSQGRYPARA